MRASCRCSRRRVSGRRGSSARRRAPWWAGCGARASRRRGCGRSCSRSGAPTSGTRGPGSGLLRGRLFRARLEAMLPVGTFEECPTRLALSAFDVLGWRTAVLDAGRLAPAIHASCAAPALFQPVRIGGRLYADGGVLDRHGLAGAAGDARVLYHHLTSRSPWRRRIEPGPPDPGAARAPRGGAPGSPAARAVPARARAGRRWSAPPRGCARRSTSLSQPARERAPCRPSALTPRRASHQVSSPWHPVQARVAGFQRGDPVPDLLRPVQVGGGVHGRPGVPGVAVAAGAAGVVPVVAGRGRQPVTGGAGRDGGRHPAHVPAGAAGERAVAVDRAARGGGGGGARVACRRAARSSRGRRASPRRGRSRRCGRRR